MELLLVTYNWEVFTLVAVSGGDFSAFQGCYPPLFEAIGQLRKLCIGSIFKTFITLYYYLI